MKTHIANWLSNMSVAAFVLGLFQATGDSEFFGKYAHYAALTLSVIGFTCSLIVLPKNKEK